jgi:hypothetical protein
LAEGQSRTQSAFAGVRVRAGTSGFNFNPPRRHDADIQHCSVATPPRNWQGPIKNTSSSRTPLIAPNVTLQCSNVALLRQRVLAFTSYSGELHRFGLSSNLGIASSSLAVENKTCPSLRVPHTATVGILTYFALTVTRCPKTCSSDATRMRATRSSSCFKRMLQTGISTIVPVFPYLLLHMRDEGEEFVNFWKALRIAHLISRASSATLPPPLLTYSVRCMSSHARRQNRAPDRDVSSAPHVSHLVFVQPCLLLFLSTRLDGRYISNGHQEKRMCRMRGYEKRGGVCAKA